MTEKPPVSLVIKDSVATVTIERAETLNALNYEVLQGIESAMIQLQDSCRSGSGYSEIRAVLIRGQGEKAFVAGADIKLMYRAPSEQISQFIKLGQRAMRAIEQTPLPVIAVVQGFALGGGMELALAADLIIASEKAKFGQPEVNLGLIPGFGGTQRLPLRVGTGRARRLVFTGQTISAAEAQQIGLVDYLCPADKLEETVSEVLGQLLNKGPLAIAAAKRAIADLSENALVQGLEREVAEFLSVVASADADQGLGAFIEKRPASFSGK